MAGGRRAVATILLAAVAAAASGTAAAHEEYVVDDSSAVDLGAFYAEALSDPFVVGPLVAGGLAVLAVVVGYVLVRPFRTDVVAFRLAMAEYSPYVPWLLRISFGVPLIGAGFGGYFFSPAVEAQLRILQVALGFLLLFGLATRAVALATLACYLVGIALAPALLLQFEFVAGTLAIALVGSGRPSADHVLQRLAGTPETAYGRVDFVYDRARALQSRAEPYEVYVPTVIRLGLGVTFVYLGATQKLLQPGLALAVVERYELTAAIPVPPELWVLGAGLAEVALGLALLAGVLTRGVAATALLVFTLTLFALPDDPVLAHVGLYGLASVLLITGGGPYALDEALERGAPTVEVATGSVEQGAGASGAESP